MTEETPERDEHPDLPPKPLNEAMPPEEGVRPPEEAEESDVDDGAYMKPDVADADPTVDDKEEQDDK